MKIGAQLFTCTAFCQTLDGLSETLKKVADIGYTTVQLSGVCKYEADWMRENLEKNGLSAVITHYDINRIADSTDAVIDFHKKIGIKYIGVGGLRGHAEPEYKVNPVPYWEKFVEDFLPAAKKIRDAGLYFMYHNHHYEFNEFEGRQLHDFLLEKFPADVMGFTSDLYWYKEAGKDPVEMLNLLKGRTPAVHYKDLLIMPDGEHRCAPIGEGILDWDAIIETSINNGVEYALVEQDCCYGEDPFVCLKRSYDFLKFKGLD